MLRVSRQERHTTGVGRQESAGAGQFDEALVKRRFAREIDIDIAVVPSSSKVSIYELFCQLNPNFGIGQLHGQTSWHEKHLTSFKTVLTNPGFKVLNILLQIWCLTCEAILAALGALPRSSLIQVLRRSAVFASGLMCVYESIF